jgi:hypothetical protein
MRKFRLPETRFPGEVSELLFVAWVQYFAEQRLGLRQHGSSGAGNADVTYNFGSPVESNFSLRKSSAGEWDLASAKEVPEGGIEGIVADAKDRLAGDFGSEVVYQANLKSSGFSMTPTSMSNFARLLGDQVFITGKRRLGSRILLEFTPEPSEDPSVPQIFTPAIDIRVTVFIPGPTSSDLTQR